MTTRRVTDQEAAAVLALDAMLVLGLVAPVAPASAGVLDKLYEKLVQEYWIWAFNQPEATNPLVGNAPFSFRAA